MKRRRCGVSGRLPSTLSPNPDAGLLPERGNCEVYELEDITSQIRH